MKQAKLKSSHLGLIIVVSTLTVLMFILIAAIVILFFTSRLNAAEPVSRSLLARRSPLTIERVDPALALASLGGVSEADVISQAITKERPETALAALMFQPGLSDKETAGAFLQLAPVYINSGQTTKGLFCYKMAGSVATLSPDMADMGRADLFLQISEGLIAANQSELAKLYLDQAFAVASRSPFLQVVQRRTLLEQLQKNYMVIGERTLARTSLDLSANPPDVTLLAGSGVILSKGEAIFLPEPVQETEAKRWIRAQELAALLVERGGNAPPSSYNALREALLTEDDQKLPFYEAELAGEAQLSRKIDITLAKIAWLSTKYRIAQRAFGLSLVPKWEKQAEQIRADLTKTYETLFALYADLIVALPDASQIDKATLERLRREVLAGELGRYPNYPEEQRQKQLLDASAKLISTQPELNVFMGLRQVDNEEMYTLTFPEVSGE